MNRFADSTYAGANPPKITRQEAEELCLLIAADGGVIPASELACELGLDPSHGPALMRDMASLVAKGWIHIVGDQSAVTTALGREVWRSRLMELQIDSSVQLER